MDLPAIGWVPYEKYDLELLVVLTTSLVQNMEYNAGAKILVETCIATMHLRCSIRFPFHNEQDILR